MSNDFEKVLITDDKLDFKNKIKFGVFRGGQSVNYQTFAALSATPNSQVFSVQIPSESVAVDRRVLWRCKVVLKITGAQANRGSTDFLINYGKTDAFAPFPLHNCVQNMSAQINSTQVNFQTEDLLLPIQKMFSEEDLGHYNSYTPTYQDKYFDYADGVNANNNPLGSYNNSAYSKLLPRGSWVIDSISSNPPGQTVVAPTVSSNDVYVTATFTEPLMMSPFTYAPCENDEVGLYGIQSISFNINMLTNPRIWRNSNGFVDSVTINKFETAELLFNFISPKPSQLIASRQPVKYYEIPRFTNSAVTVNANDRKQLNSATIQISQIPQYLIVWARKNNRVAYRDADQFFAIDALTIQFNNQSGILSSATQQDLYRISAHNNLHMPYLEWSGKGNSNISNANSGYNKVNLCGGPIILEFCKDIVVTEDFLSIGSLGNFNLQVNASVQNNTANNQDVVLCLATVNVGLFVSERGTSSSYTGILTRQDVLDAQQLEPLPEADMRRLVGKGWMENLASMLKAGVSNAPKVVEKICEIAPSLAKGAKSLMGDGRAGAGVAGGLMKRLK